MINAEKGKIVLSSTISHLYQTDLYVNLTIEKTTNQKSPQTNKYDRELKTGDKYTHTTRKGEYRVWFPHKKCIINYRP